MTNPFYQSKKWKHKRNVRLRIDHYECQECKRYGKTTKATTVHHIYPLELYPVFKLSIANLLSLCGNCHNTFHDRKTNEITPKGEQWQRKMQKVIGISL